MDPYKVLGVDKNATDEQIRNAYHELVKKYHPDKYVNNPLADLAEEKLREVNEAYELLTKTGGAGIGSYNTYGPGSSAGNTGSYTYTGSGSGGGYYSNNSTSYSSYANAQNSSHYSVRQALDRNQLSKAEQLLYSSGSRDPEWYFLAGVLSYKKGYYDDAMGKVGYAMQMDPTNQEYRNVYQQIMSTGTIYKQGSSSRGYDSSNACLDCLTCYCCSSMISPCW